MKWLLELLSPVIDKALAALLPIAEKKLDELKDEALKILAAQVPILMDKLLALLPMAVATATKAATDEIMKKFSHVLDADPDIPVLSNVFDLSETIRHGLNDSTPDEIHIPSLSDILGGVVGGIFKGR